MCMEQTAEAVWVKPESTGEHEATQRWRYEAMAPVETLLAPAATSERLLCSQTHTAPAPSLVLLQSGVLRGEKVSSKSFFVELRKFLCVNKWIKHLLLQQSVAKLEFSRRKVPREGRESKAKASTALSFLSSL
jgi:hypothetical protein